MYTPVKNAEGHSFVNGKTKHIAAMNQKDLEVLFNNGDSRVKKEPDPEPTPQAETPAPVEVEKKKKTVVKALPVQAEPIAGN